MNKKGIRKTLILAIAAVLMTSLLSGCLYVKIKVPLDVDVAQTRLGDKVGTSTAQSVLWLFAWGDAGTEAAAKSGNITTINHMDREYYMLLFGLYSKETTIVYGD